MEINVKLFYFLRSEAFWRFVDALFPRGFGFIIHTWLIWRFGAASYAFPAWIISTFTLINSFIPDPCGYILLSKSKLVAKIRIRLLTPWIWSKALLSVIITAVSPFFFVEDLFGGMPDGDIVLILAGSIFFSLGESLWATCGTNKFSTGKLKEWAQWGIVIRVVSLVLIGILDKMTNLGVGEVLLIFGLPIFFYCLCVLPLPEFGKRSFYIGYIVLSRYSIWVQINGFISVFLGQAPIFFAGAIPSLTTSTVGYISYVIRILNFLIQPLTILQSVIVRDRVQNNFAYPEMKMYKLIYRCVGLSIIILSLILGWFSPNIDYSIFIIGFGLGVFAMFRFELAVLVSLRDTMFLSTNIFIPAVFLFFSTIFFWQDDLLGISASVTASYIVVAILTKIQFGKRIVVRG